MVWRLTRHMWQTSLLFMHHANHSSALTGYAPFLRLKSWIRALSRRSLCLCLHTHNVVFRQSVSQRLYMVVEASHDHIISFAEFANKHTTIHA